MGVSIYSAILPPPDSEQFRKRIKYNQIENQISIVLLLKVKVHELYLWENSLYETELRVKQTLLSESWIH